MSGKGEVHNLSQRVRGGGGCQVREKCTICLSEFEEEEDVR